MDLSLSFQKSSFFLNLFIFGCVGSLLLCAGFLQLLRGEATLRCGARASHYGGFTCSRARALGRRASLAVVCGLSSCGLRDVESKLSSCGARAQLLRSMWDLPRQGLEPVSPALAGRFLTTVPPGKSQKNSLSTQVESTAPQRKIIHCILPQL